VESVLRSGENSLHEFSSIFLLKISLASK